MAVVPDGQAGSNQIKSNQPEDLGSSPLHACAFLPSDDRDLAANAAAVSLAAAPVSFLSLKKPKTGREQTGTLSTTGAATRTTPEEPWNTILPEEFIRGESTERHRGGDGRRRAGLRPARRVEEEDVEWR
nr:unnamed protein product [Digitaria exilis]